MANKKISFSRTSTSALSSLEVYRDISLVADPNDANIVKTYKRVIPMAYLAGEFTELATSRSSVDAGPARQVQYEQLSDLLSQNGISGYAAGSRAVLTRDPAFSLVSYSVGVGESYSVEISAGSQFVARSEFVPAAISSREQFEACLDVFPHGQLSDRFFVQGEASSPSIPNQGVLLALQYADAYYEASYSSDLCAAATFLSGQETAEAGATRLAEDRTGYKLMVLEDDGAVSSYAEWKKAKAWNPYKLSKLVNVDAVYNSLRNIFTWQPGERILDPVFGTRLREYLYQGLTEESSKQIIAEIRRAIDMYEPRARVQQVVDVSTAADIEDNTIQLDIVFTIPSLSREQFHYTYTWRQTD